jgi:hypothetical protein
MNSKKIRSTNYRILVQQFLYVYIEICFDDAKYI